MDNLHPTDVFASHVCAICLKQSKYVCPRCGINYCSLVCYRSGKHITCSEAFYRDCCTESLKNRFSDSKCRSHMLDILRREASASNRIDIDGQESSNSDVDGPHEETDCRSHIDEQHHVPIDRFSDLNIDSDSLDWNILWSRLTKREKRDFYRLINTGAFGNFLPAWIPWWFPEKSVCIEEMSQPKDTIDECRKRASVPLPLRKIFPSGKMPHHSVVYMLIDTLLGYAFVARLYNGDYNDLKHEAAFNLCQIVTSFNSRTDSNRMKKEKLNKDAPRTMILSPINKPGSMAFSSVAQVVGSVQTQLCRLQLQCNPETMIVLLEDLMALTNVAHHINRALDDVYILLDSVRTELKTEHESSSKQLTNASHKIAFLRSCFNVEDPIAVQWQASVFPTLQSQIAAELCNQLTNFNENKHKPVVHAAGPNWRQMIRD